VRVGPVAGNHASAASIYDNVYPDASD